MLRRGMRMFNNFAACSKKQIKALTDVKLSKLVSVASDKYEPVKMLEVTEEQMARA